MDDKRPKTDLEINKLDDEGDQTRIHDTSNIKLKNYLDPLPGTPNKDDPKDMKEEEM